MTDQFITGILPKSHFRFSIIDCSQICSHLDRVHNLDARLSNFLSKTLMGAFFIATMVKEDQKISIQWKDEFKHSVLAYSNREGAMKGVAYPGEFREGDIRNDFILGTGILKVIRWIPDSDPYQSFSSLIEDTFEANLMKYIADSEQVSTIVLMDTQAIKLGAISSRGFFLQALPEAKVIDIERIYSIAKTKMNREIIGTRSIVEIAQDLSNIFNEDTTILKEGKPYHYCDCSRNKISQVLVSLGEKEVKEILLEQGKIEVECEFCKSIYDYFDSDVEKLFPNP